MKLYFSGVSSHVEAEWLRKAGVNRILVDPTDLRYSTGFPTVALDSGAYRAWKRGGTVDTHRLVDLASSGKYEWTVTPDVIEGDPWDNFNTWDDLRKDIPGLVPVWHYGPETDTLREYLRLTGPNGLVGIGALVPLMREKNEAMLMRLLDIAGSYPNRLHLFGANWLKALNNLRSLIKSADTSKFLDGARYGHVIFVHTSTGRLSQAPAKVLGLGHLTRSERCIESAKAMATYTEEK